MYCIIVRLARQKHTLSLRALGRKAAQPISSVRGFCTPAIGGSTQKVVEIYVGGTKYVCSCVCGFQQEAALITCLWNYGCRFAMLRETLQKSPRLAREFENAALTGHLKDGIPFIDRDPAVFPSILSYMRTGKLLPPKDTVKLTGMCSHSTRHCLHCRPKSTPM